MARDREKIPVILGVITARAGSKRLPGKNKIDLGGKPLVEWSIDSLLESEKVHIKVVSTDDEDIIKIAEERGMAHVRRGPELASDTATLESAVSHAIGVEELMRGGAKKVVTCVLMQANVPFRPKGLVDKCLEIFEEGGYDSLVTVKKIDECPQWAVKRTKNGLLSLKKDVKGYRKQDMQPFYWIDGSVLIFKRECLDNAKPVAHGFLGKRIFGLVQDSPYYSVDIDEKEDLDYAQYLVESGIIEF